MDSRYKKHLLGNGNWLGDLSGLTFTDITAQESFLLPGTEVEFKFGNDPDMFATVQRSSGQFGGDGIDEILYPALGGVEIQLTASMESPDESWSQDYWLDTGQANT